MKRMENQEPDYGNWVPAAMMKILAALTVVLLTAELLFLFFLENVILSVIGGIFLIATVLFTIYMWRCRVIFDFSRGGLMGEIHQYLIDHLSGLERKGDSTRYRLRRRSSDDSLRLPFSGREDHRNGLLECGVELRKGAM